MPDDSPGIPYLDYTSIRFPSDNLTLGKIRKVEPEKFDVDGFPRLDLHHWDDNASWRAPNNIMGSERLLAQDAFAKAADLPVDLPADDYVGMIDDLMEYYPRYGLASGAKHALELIKDFQAQAAAQGQVYNKAPRR